ncbi:TIGR04219 family outer membrane beta-barrel protein [Alkalimarinus sediminis]|uniref:TIGR04219 family outer membrane beta-barrel protein n=1 Tax=Alkalimarinus sediminis TaxID=1632866 RepID=A0A9E8KRA4_9ALTE|nr:TIGR04219 family outer membrane beta-barrel protein [Alkalimarinus sediminis]UZW75832.1 TIGR04219 family outer membrane beta-barrel protein [Alkalimarinus sediminis]
MKLLKTGVSVLAASLLSVSANADVLGLSASLAYWSPDTSGTIQSGGDKIDVDKDLGLGRDDSAIFIATFEHPVPIIPNFRFQYSDVDQVTYGSVDNVDFKGQNFDGAVQTSLDLTNYDFTLYYEVLDNWVNLDLGLTAKVFDGSLILREQNANPVAAYSKTDIDDIIPMLYGSAIFELPITSLSVGAEGSAISIGSDTAYDLVAMIRFRASFFGVEAGYRAMGLDGKVNGINVDARSDGPYLSALLMF